MELVANGDVVAEADARSETEWVFDTEIALEKSGWIAVRAEGPGNEFIIRDKQYAHTNPVWITVERKPNSMAATDAAYFLKWIDRLEAAVTARDRIPGERNREKVRRQFEEAQSYYRRLIVN